MMSPSSLMLSAPPTSSLLRRETRDEHRDAERHLAGFARFETPLALVGLLALLEGFHAGCERTLAPWIEVPDVPPTLLAGWRRAAGLRRDLGRLGTPVTGRAATLAPPADRDAALGAWYVLEGSRLGGRMLAREARRRLPGSERALGTLGSEGAPGRWPAFKRWLDGPGGVADADAAVAGARTAFSALEGWAHACR